MNNIIITNKDKKVNSTGLFIKIKKYFLKKKIKKDKNKKVNNIYNKDLLRNEIISLGFIPKDDIFDNFS